VGTARSKVNTSGTPREKINSDGKRGKRSRNNNWKTTKGMERQAAIWVGMGQVQFFRDSYEKCSQKGNYVSLVKRESKKKCSETATPTTGGGIGYAKLVIVTVDTKGISGKM